MLPLASCLLLSFDTSSCLSDGPVSITEVSARFMAVNGFSIVVICCVAKHLACWHSEITVQEGLGLREYFWLPVAVSCFLITFFLQLTLA